MVLIPFVAHPFGPPARPKGVGELGDGENTFIVELLALLFCHGCQQAQIVLLNGLLSAPVPEFAFTTVAVQDKVLRNSARGHFSLFRRKFPPVAKRAYGLDL